MRPSINYKKMEHGKYKNTESCRISQLPSGRRRIILWRAAMITGTNYCCAGICYQSEARNQQ